MVFPRSFRDFVSKGIDFRRGDKRVATRPRKRAAALRAGMRLLERLEDRLPFSVELVKDVNAIPDYLRAPEMVGVGDVFYFVAATEDSGRELWKSDGTQAGTVRVKDIRPGPGGSSPSMLANVGGTLFFQADDGQHGSELWKSDGTELGTVLVKDINPGTLSSSPKNLADVDGSLYFAALTETLGYELWKSDGTDQGTTLVADINAGPGDSDPQSITAANGILYFAASDGMNGSELWKSDGSAQGTIRVQDIKPGSDGSSPRCIVHVDGNVFFLATGAAATEALWMSDGTAEGTRMVISPSVPSPYAIRELTNLNGSLVFAFTGSSGGSELWKADGKTGETTLLRDIRPGKDGSNPMYLTVADGVLYFTASDEFFSEVWRSDGTTEGTYKAIDRESMGSFFSAFNLTSVNGSLYFLSWTLFVSDTLDGLELYKSDGTLQGTDVVDVIPRRRNEDVYPSQIVTTEDRVYLSVRDQDNGQRLWTSDGTSDSITVLTSGGFYPGSAEVNSLVNLGGSLFFKADDGVHRDELWHSDGSDSGTTMITDLYPGGFPSGTPYIVIGNEVYFIGYGFRLWRSDGTAAGTYQAWNRDRSGQRPGVIGNLTYFKGELYFTDGFGAIQKLKMADSAATSTASGLGDAPQYYVDPALSELTVAGDFLYYVKRQSSGRDELWKTDGTSTGTQRLKVFSSPTNEDLRPRHLVNLNGTLFFQAYDELHGSELWKSDGTIDGTTLVRDIHSGLASSSPHQLKNVEGTLYFAASDSSHGTELWKSDGTELGTVLVRDILPGTAGSAPHQLVNVRGQLYFAADDGVHGSELWTSDGSGMGTRLVKDIRPGPRGSAAIKLTAIQGALYFQADDGQTGAELWRSDGTRAGTQLVVDLAVPGGSNPTELLVVGDDLYFAATTPELGTELWRIQSLDADSDGTANFIEDAAPNLGDGNRDGILDSHQAEVVSVRDHVSELLVTFVAPPDEQFEHIRFSTDGISPLPGTLSFPVGVIDFAISTDNGSSADSDAVRDITVIFQDASQVNVTYKFEELSGNRDGYWRRFLGDPVIGVSIEPGDDQITLHLKDGQVGDTDGLANGVIEYRGAFAIDRRTARWQNPVMAGDTNEDGFITPIDALWIVNELNRNEARELPTVSPMAASPYYDVSGDNFITPFDVLLIVNELSRSASLGGREAGRVDPAASSVAYAAILSAPSTNGWISKPQRLPSIPAGGDDRVYPAVSAIDLLFTGNSVHDFGDDASQVERPGGLDGTWSEDLDWLSSPLESVIIARRLTLDG